MPGALLVFGAYALDLRRPELLEQGTPVELPPLVLRLLVYLAANRARTVPIDELREEVWRGVHVSDAALHQAIRQARRAVGDDGRRQKVIRTFARAGYRFVAPVEETTASPQRGASGYVGRRDLLGRLDHVVAKAAGGRRRLLVIRGEPGIGKTRTLDEIARRARSAGALVARGAGSPHAGAPPFWPWVQALRDLASGRPVQSVLRDVESLASSARATGPEARIAGGVDALGAASRFHLFDEVARALRRAASLGPVVVLLDDLHDASTAAFELFEFLARELDPADAVLVAAAFRPADALRSSGRAAVIARLSTLPHVVDVHLEGLSPGESRELVALHEPRPLAPAVLDALVDRAHGNPFYLVELARDLGRAPEHAVTRRDAGRRVGRSMQRLIATRLAALRTPTRRWLRVASAIGVRVERARVHRLLPDVDEASAVAEAIEAGLVVDAAAGDSGLAFSHRLIRDAVYAEIGAGERRDLHLRIAEQIHDQQLVEAAFHFAEAAPLGGIERAVSYLQRAARVAVALFDPETAGALYGRALEILAAHGPEHPAMHCDLLIAFGRTQLAGGRLEAGRESLESASQLARRHGYGARLAHAALAIADSVDYEAVTREDLVERITEAIDRVGEDEGSLRAQLLARLAVEVRYRPDGADAAERLLVEALDLVRASDDVAARARVLEYATLVRWSATAPRAWIGLSHELVDAAREAGNADLEFRGVVGLVTEFMEIGDHPAMERGIVRCADLAERYPAPFQRASRSLIETAQHLLRGEFAVAERGVRSSLLSDVPETLLPALTQLYYLRLETGRIDELEAQLLDRVQREPHRDSWKLGLARLYVDVDRRDEAARFLARASRPDAMPRDRHWLPTVALMAEVVAALDETQRAAELIDLLSPFEALCAVYGRGTLFYGSVSHFLGVLSRTTGAVERAEAHFRRAMAVHETMQSPPWQLRTGVEWAVLLAECGTDPDRAIDTNRLRALADGLAMPVLEARIDSIEIGRMASVRPRRGRSG